MNLNEIIKTEMCYVSLFSKRIATKSGYVFYDASQKDKYAHNFMMLLRNPITIEELSEYEQKQKENGFVIYRLENDLHIKTDYNEVEEYGYFTAPIDQLKIKKDKFCDISLLDPHDDLFYEFMYQEDLEFGEPYAKGNIKRQKEVLLQHKDQFFYIKVMVGHEIVGNLNAFIDGKYAKIDEFYVKEQFQRQGIGSALMSYMINLLKSKGITDVYLVTNMRDTAKELYKRMGYIQKGSYVQYKKEFQMC